MGTSILRWPRSVRSTATPSVSMGGAGRRRGEGKTASNLPEREDEGALSQGTQTCPLATASTAPRPPSPAPRTVAHTTHPPGQAPQRMRSSVGQDAMETACDTTPNMMRNSSPKAARRRARRWRFWSARLVMTSAASTRSRCRECCRACHASSPTAVRAGAGAGVRVRGVRESGSEVQRAKGTCLRRARRPSGRTGAARRRSSRRGRARATARG